LKKRAAFLFLALCGSAGASQLYNMTYISAISSPGFFVFDVNGTTQQLLCDQFLPNVTTQPYVAIGYTLADLLAPNINTTNLALANDPDRLHKYQEVAILDILAYNDPTLAPDVVRANRIIVDGSGPTTPGAAALLQFVATQNPANYPQLTNFIIFVGPVLNGATITQEQTGFPGGGTGGNVPEPGTAFLLSGGIFAGLLAKRRLASRS